MKKKFLLSCMTAAMVFGLVPQANISVQANNNYQGNQFEQGKYDRGAEFPYGENWSENFPHAGTEKMEIKWQTNLGDKYWPGGRPAIGKDGTLYVVSNATNSFHAVNKDGSIKWEKKGKRFQGVPVIGEDGTIYVSSGESHYALDAYDPDGTLKWRTPTLYSPQATLAIDKDGVIYVAGVRSLEAFSPDGTQKWRSVFPHGGEGKNKVLISKSGLIHTLVTSTAGSSSTLYTHDKNGVEKWFMKLGAEALTNSFTLGPNGDIYVNEGEIIKIISPEGELKQRWDVPGKVIGAPTISEKDGTIYVVGIWDLIAFNPDLTQKWHYKISAYGTPSLDANGLIYALTRDSLVVFNPDGTLKSQIKIPGMAHNGYQQSRLSIGKDGTIYTVGRDGIYAQSILTAIGDPNAGETPCTPTKGYLELLEEKIKTNDLTDEEKEEARERLTQVLKSLE